MDLKDFRGRSSRKWRKEPNLRQEGGRKVLGGGDGVRFLAAISAEGLKTSHPVVCPLSEMVITACLLNFAQCWDFLEELPEVAFKFSLIKIVILCSIHAV